MSSRQRVLQEAADAVGGTIVSGWRCRDGKIRTLVLVEGARQMVALGAYLALCGEGELIPLLYTEKVHYSHGVGWTRDELD